ncbi:putative vacuolar protein sorting-associated protein Ist1 [Helianthus anomalus]
MKNKKGVQINQMKRELAQTCAVDLKEAITSVICAAPRCSDISELYDVRKQFTAKYGKDFVSAAIELHPDCGVNHMLVLFVGGSHEGLG